MENIQESIPLPCHTIHESIPPPIQVSISQNDLKELLEELERLQKENKQLKEQLS